MVLYTSMLNPTSYAYLNWKECLKKRQALRKNLALTPDHEEDKLACRTLYKLYFREVTNGSVPHATKKHP